MSNLECAVQVFRELETEDFKVLQSIEAAMSKKEYVPVDQIVKFSKLPKDRVEYTLDKLKKLNLLYRLQGAYVGHTLSYTGYDCLAINNMVKSGVIEAFGQPLGVGKEADVYDALSPNKTRIAVKFQRLGRISFRQTRRKRAYITEHASWLFQSKIAAEKEFQFLQLAHKNGVAVPEPIRQNRHVIAMGMIEGGELSKYKEVGNPKKVLKEIFLNIKKAYVKAHVIHSDLSEYNILLKPDMHVLIIDWPQAVMTDHPNAEELLERDIKNVTVFFRRRFNVEADIVEVCNYVTGKSRSLAI